WQRNGQRYVVEWKGRPVSRIDKAHQATVVSAGLGTFVSVKGKTHFVSDVTPHVWRHTVASWLAQKKTNPKRAAAFLGMSFETYVRTYAKHDPGQFDDIHAAL